jgi:hypothetical protein
MEQTMEGISDIKVVGTDVRRPAKFLSQQPYIDLFFKLSHKAPPDWCEAFNALMGTRKSNAKINKAEGLYIETWVRLMDEIPVHLEDVKKGIEETSRRYIARILERQQNSGGETDSLKAAGGEQGRLNKIIDGLKFD